MLGDLFLRDAIANQWLCFREPVEIVQVHTLAEVMPQLRRIEAWVEENGGWAVGFISYEAAPAFDPALRVRSPHDFPLLWFGLYPSPTLFNFQPLTFNLQPPLLPCTWAPSLTRKAYERAILGIREHIARGNTYQVNYTLRLRAPFDDDAQKLFANLVRAQPNSYAAFVDTGRYAICSASPELFVRREGKQLVMRPMKGTAPRGRFTREDRARANWLYHSEKNRAENVMIVDMVRNDLGRIADVGSVRVTRLWDIERYPTVWQMTSTVEATTDASFAEVLGAIFPCASITGAPKVSTMRLIAKLETAPRRVYTGCIGYLAPGRRAQFNVAIRTVLIDRARKEAEYGVGGGIVWDSEAGDEYDECRHKARVLTEPRAEFSLLESLRWSPEEGYWLLEYHLRRLRDSAAYFDFAYDEARVLSELERVARTLPPLPHKVRLLLASDSSVTVTAASLEPSREPVRLALASAPVNSQDRFLFHKTTQRAAYDAARQAHPEADDVLLWNERGELTETCVANVVVQFGDAYFTPPLECGLLAGTYRAALLDQGRLRERVIRVEELNKATGVFRINSVRGWQRAQIMHN